MFPEHTYVSLDHPQDAQLAEEDSRSFLAKYPPPLLIDELQYAPGLFRHLKQLIDRDRQANGRFILTGSQKFTLMKEVSDSLAGRCAILDLETLSLTELGDAFTDQLAREGLSSVLCRGFFPQLWADPDMPSADFYRSYLATYIERDVRQILNIASLRDFDRFMRVAATRTGQLLNKSDVAKDVGVSPGTINDWISVLQASNQVALLEPYFRSPGKRVVKSPKLYFSDPGLACFLLGLGRDTLLDSPLAGAIWETFVFGELRKSLGLIAPEASLWFYRDQQREVDFVLSHGGRLTFADAKLKELPNERDFASVTKTASLFPEASGDVFLITSTSDSYPLAAGQRVASGFDLTAWTHASVGQSKR
jgi:predicted AAA+ superfamily ATPase